MTEDELIAKVRELAANPRRATSAAAWSGNYFEIAESFRPAPVSVVKDAQLQFGFPIPNLLPRLSAEVANGGIGPGDGIYGLKDGMIDDGYNLPLPDLFLAERESEHWAELAGAECADRTIPICDWGRCTLSNVRPMDRGLGEWHRGRRRGLPRRKRNTIMSIPQCESPGPSSY